MSEEEFAESVFRDVKAFNKTIKENPLLDEFVKFTKEEFDKTIVPVGSEKIQIGLINFFQR